MDSSTATSPAPALLRQLIMAYPDLSPPEKKALEQSVHLGPYELSVEEVRHLLSADFPFTPMVSFWWQRYLAVAAFQRLHGRFPSGDRHRALRSWISQQRYRQKKGRLGSAQARALNRLGFVWNFQDQRWQEHFDDFQRQTQKAQGPAQGPMYTSRIRTWLHSMRRQAWDRITPRQRRLLEEAGLVREPRKQSWETNVRDLEEWKAKNGNLVNLPCRLSQFIHKMRKRKSAGRLTREEQERLSQTGLTWTAHSTPLETGYTSVWEMRYAQARAYIRTYATDEVPPLYKWENQSLAKWIQFQKASWARLPEGQRQRLLELPLSPPGTGRQEAWQKRYRRAKAIQEHHHPRTIADYGRYNRTTLGWLRKQREHWRRLNRSQQDQLTALGMAIDQPLIGGRKTWQEGFAEAKKLHDRLGPYCPSAYGKENPQMVRWLRYRAQHASILTTEQQGLLRELGISFVERRQRGKPGCPLPSSVS